MVHVISGGLKNLKGTVVNSIRDEVTIIPAIEDICEPMTFKPIDLVKHFEEGDHVKICKGKY